MRKLIGTLGLLVIIICAVGFFRGWFSVGTEDQDSETNVEIRIDKERIKEDAQTAADRVGQLGHGEQTSQGSSDTQ